MCVFIRKWLFLNNSEQWLFLNDTFRYQIMSQAKIIVQARNTCGNGNWSVTYNS